MKDISTIRVLNQAGTYLYDPRGEVIRDVNLVNEGLESAFVYGDFFDAKTKLENEGFDVISAEATARLRIINASEVIPWGHIVREAFIYVPKKGVYLTKESPIIKYPEEARHCKQEPKESGVYVTKFFLTDGQVEEALADSVRIRMSKKQSSGTMQRGTKISTGRFKENEITTYLFGKYAYEYGYFLEGRGIHSYRPWLIEPRDDRPFAVQLEFRGPGNGGDLLDHGDHDLSSVCIRGIRRV